MRVKKLCTAASKALAVVPAVLLLTLMLAPHVFAAGHYRVLHRFTGGADGLGPSGVIVDGEGNLYGMTSYGGAYNYGTVFVVPKGRGLKVLYSFRGGSDGAVPHPYAKPFRDSAGNLYGITYEGGAFNQGTIFKIDKTGKERVLYSFTGGADGGYPTSNLIMDEGGNLYGTTTRGGTGTGLGVAFRLKPNPDGSWSETVLHSFAGYDGDAAEPYAGLSRDKAGIFYGVTWQGGAYGQGTVFQMDATGAENVLFSFSGPDGAHAYKPPIFDADGNLYSTTAFGGDYSCPSPLGDGCGTVYKIDASGNQTVLHAFTDGADGGFPVGNVVSDGAGNLYGTAQFGGAYGWGVVFKLTHGTWTERVLHSFTGNPGSEPLAGPVFDLEGNLYGSTNGDNITTFGSVFEITP